MTNVVDELKKQMQQIQYYSLLQKLFISYVFKHLEGQIEHIAKNNQISNLNSFMKNIPKMQQNPNIPFNLENEQEFNNMTGGINKDSLEFMKNLQNSGINIQNLFTMDKQNTSNPTNNNNLNSDANLINNLSNYSNCQGVKDPIDLLKNLNSSINNNNVNLGSNLNNNNNKNNSFKECGNNGTNNNSNNGSSKNLQNFNANFPQPSASASVQGQGQAPGAQPQQNSSINFYCKAKDVLIVLLKKLPQINMV